MIVKVITLFPDMMDSIFRTSIIGRAVEKGTIQIEIINLRDFAKNKHKQVDDYPYGGGSGMLLMPEPIFECVDYLIKKLNGKSAKVLYTSPQGKVFNHKMAEKLAQEEAIIFLCGHYEGIDQRVIDNLVDLEVSIGDYVLTGGELPAAVIIDSMCRFVPGVLSSEESYKNESLYDGLLEYPQYTRPNEYRGLQVPEILLSGDHKKIAQWRKNQSLINTFTKRPDLIKKKE